MRDEVYSDMKISMMDVDSTTGEEKEIVTNVPVADNVVNNEQSNIIRKSYKGCRT